MYIFVEPRVGVTCKLFLKNLEKHNFLWVACGACAFSYFANVQNTKIRKNVEKHKQMSDFFPLEELESADGTIVYRTTDEAWRRAFSTRGLLSMVRDAVLEEANENLMSEVNASPSFEDYMLDFVGTAYPTFSIESALVFFIIAYRIWSMRDAEGKQRAADTVVGFLQVLKRCTSDIVFVRAKKMERTSSCYSVRLFCINTEDHPTGLTCPVCIGPITVAVRTKCCGNYFHYTCFEQLLTPLCPLCRRIAEVEKPQSEMTSKE